MSASAASPACPGIELQRLGTVAVLTLANPPANTWTRESLAGLKQLVGELDANRDVYDLFDTEDQREGVAAFLAKRTPQWRNG